jgi:hypothetical protein
LFFLFRRISPLLAAALFFATACREEKDPLRRTLEGIVKAAHERNAEGVAENLTADFHDEEGEDIAGVVATLRRYFAAYESIDVKIRDLEIERASESARARFVAGISGRPRKLAGLDRFFPSDATYRFDLRLVPEAGRWKVAWASWEGVGGR